LIPDPFVGGLASDFTGGSFAVLVLLLFGAPTLAFCFSRRLSSAFVFRFAVEALGADTDVLWAGSIADFGVSVLVELLADGDPGFEEGVLILAL